MTPDGPLHEQMADLAMNIEDDELGEAVIRFAARVMTLERRYEALAKGVEDAVEELDRKPHTDAPLVTRVSWGRRLRALLDQGGV